MKTPRELLLNRHRNIEPQLDDLRHGIVQAMREPASQMKPQEAHAIGFVGTCWQELFLSCRRYWQGLGVAWAVVLGFAVAGAFGNDGVRTTAQSSGSRMEALHAQLEFRNKLLGVAVIEESRTAHPEPGPRSELFREERYV